MVDIEEASRFRHTIDAIQSYRSHARREHGELRDDPVGHLAAWLTIGLVNVASTAIHAPRLGLGARLVVHAHALAYAWLIGSLLMAAVALWQRWGPARARYAWLATFAAAVAFSQVGLPSDLQSGVGAVAPEGYDRVAAHLAAAVAGAGLALGAYVARRLAATRARHAVTLGGLGLAFGHQLAWPNLYPAIHVFCTVTAAVVLAPCLAPLGRRCASALSPRTRLGALALACSAVAFLVVTPSGQVLSVMLRVPGAVWPPVAASWRASSAPGGIDPSTASPEAAGLDTRAWAPWLANREQAPPKPPSASSPLPDDAVVLLIIVDALRADVLQPPYDAALPAMRRLRDEGVHFTHAWSPAPATMESRASLLTGRYAMQIPWRRPPKGRDRRLRPDHDAVPRIDGILMKQAGVEKRSLTKYALRVKGAGPVGDEAARWLREDVAPGQAWFAYIHFYEAHAPYHAGGTTGTPKERYLGAAKVVDDAIGTILAAVDRDDLSSRVLVVLTADHGEAFGEHGSKYHGATTYEEVTRVPFIFRGPWFEPRVVETPVSLIDFFPTVLDLFGLPTPGAAMGQSLAPILMGQDPALARPIFIDSQGKDRALLFPDGIKLVHRARGGLFEVYDLRDDPEELENLADERDDTAARIGTFRRFVEVHRHRP